MGSTSRLVVSLAALAAGAGLFTAAAVAWDAKAATADVLRVNYEGDVPSTDPAIAYDPISWQWEYATCAKLVNYPDRRRPMGSRLVPELAVTLPRVSRDGRTYTFVLRRGVRFSPPSRETVTAATFAHIFKRDVDSKLVSPAINFLRELDSVHARGLTLTIRLKTRAPDFLPRLAMPFFCAVPRGTPVETPVDGELPSAGPYFVASHVPNRSFVLERNPRYRGPRPHRFRTISFKLGTESNLSVLQIKRGEADYAGDGLPPGQVGTLARRYGPGSATARRHHQRFFADPMLALSYLALNTSRPLFASRSMRRAVSFAIDRAVLARANGEFAATPTDHLLPPGIRGRRATRLYPLARPDLKTARALTRSRRTRAVLYTCTLSHCLNTAQVLREELKRIGMTVDIHQFGSAVLLAKLGTRGEPFDIATQGWVADYADPFDFINVLLDGTTIRGENNLNTSYFDDPRFNRRMERAETMQGRPRYRAYGQLDVDLARAAPIVPTLNPNLLDFFSARIGCERFQPVYGMDLGALCLRRHA